MVVKHPLELWILGQSKTTVGSNSICHVFNDEEAIVTEEGDDIGEEDGLVIGQHLDQALLVRLDQGFGISSNGLKMKSQT